MDSVPAMPASDFRADLMAGKTVLVTGGATGIGLGICRFFAAHGANVAMGGRRQEALDAACDLLRSEGAKGALGVRCDVRNPEDCQHLVAATVERFGQLDVLVNNAAGNFSTPAEHLSPNGFKTIMDIDLHGSFNMAKAALPHLRASPSGPGVIIHTSATLHYRAFPFQMAASAAKAAIDTMTNALGVEWGTDHGVRCVAIAPGPIEGTVGGPGGRVFGKMLKGKQQQEQQQEDLRKHVPLGRFGTVWDIANAALFVSSSAGAYINATCIVVDGGQWHGTSGQYLMAKDIIARASAHERKTHKGGVAKL